MPFLGSQPTEGYRSIAKQTITGDGSTTYVLNNKVTSANDIEVFVNNVRQEPGVAYTATGNSITFADAITSGDSCYIVYQGRAVTSNLIESQNIADGAISATKTNFFINSSTTPSNPVSGQQWWNPSDYALRVYDGDTWQLVKSSFAATGGTITEAGGYRIHTFTSSGTFTVTKGATDVEYLVIAGGAGGGDGTAGGGGGAGGYRSSVSGESSGGGALAENKLTITTGVYSITVGAGGAGAASSSGLRGVNGSNSVFSSITSIGGGGGGAEATNLYTGASGGSGGGACYNNAGGSGTTGQGFAGGSGTSGGLRWTGGGGGGAAAVGQNASAYNGGNGGNGLASSITGSSVTRTGGGGGAAQSSGGGTVYGGSGGSGGGGAGAADQTGSQSVNGGDATANTGSGGGGGPNQSGSRGGNGGSGIVIIRYAI